MDRVAFYAVVGIRSNELKHIGFARYAAEFFDRLHMVDRVGHGGEMEQLVLPGAGAGQIEIKPAARYTVRRSSITTA